MAGTYPSYFPACGPGTHYPDVLYTSSTVQSGYAAPLLSPNAPSFFGTPSTSGSSLPTTPANGSPITGQKRRLRSSPSPPPTTATWSQLVGPPASFPQRASSPLSPTVPAVYDFPTFPLQFTPADFNQLDLQLPDIFEDDWQRLCASPTSVNTPASPYGEPMTWRPHAPVRQSSRPIGYPEPVTVVVPPSRSSSPVQNISSSSRSSYLQPGVLSQDRRATLQTLGTYPAAYGTVQPYVHDGIASAQLPTFSIFEAPQSFPPPAQAQAQCYKGGVKFKEPITPAAPTTPYDPSRSSSPPAIHNKKRRTEAPPTQFVPHVHTPQSVPTQGHPYQMTLSRVPGALVPQGRYNVKPGQEAGPPLRWVSFGPRGVRLADMTRGREQRDHLLPPHTPDAGLAWLHEWYADKDGRAKQRDALTLRILWPGSDMKHNTFVSLAIGRDGKARVTLPDLAERIADGVRRYFVQWAKKPPTLTNAVSRDWALGERVQFEDLVLVGLEQMTIGSWQPVLVYQPAPVTTYIAETGTKFRSRK